VWRACGLKVPFARARGLHRPRAIGADVFKKLEELAGRPIDEWRAVFPRPKRSARPSGGLRLRFPGERIKAITFKPRRLSEDEIVERDRIGLEVLPLRPASRAACLNENKVRPCPFVSCSRHLGTDITNAGSLKINFPVAPGVMDVALDDMPDTCVQDVADRGPQSFEAIANALNVCHSRGEQLVKEALAEMQAKLEAAGIEGSAQDLLLALHKN
jgi:hypothetical protein